ncbi:MAG: glycosyltransferase family 4 protein [Verrucomicrobiota bacterium]|nr:glycosyltransferase family 4 protein [Verrucomicrobiota bacterium]
MKILAITNLYPPHYLGGYELIAHAVLTALQARGHDVHILTSNHEVKGEKHSANEGQIERSLRVHGFYGHPWRGIASLVLLERHNNQMVRAALNRVRPDIVYVWNMGGISKSILLTLQKMNIPTLYYLSDHWIARGLTTDVWLNWWNRPDSGDGAALLRKILNWVGVRHLLQQVAPTNPIGHIQFPAIYFCSKALRKLTASAGFDVMHGKVIYAPVNAQKFNGVVKPAAVPYRKLLWVGRLAKDKGVMTALKAMAAIKEKFSGQLNIYGRGDADYADLLKKFVADHQLPVSFKNGSMDEMPEIYRQHDGLLFTSEWAEPFALTPLEAMASGLPVIGTTTGGSREIFRHRDNALTYTAGNGEELAERILELDNDPALRERIAITGQQEVRANYDEPLIVDQIEAYLKDVISEWQGPGLPRHDL